MPRTPHRAASNRRRAERALAIAGLALLGMCACTSESEPSLATASAPVQAVSVWTVTSEPMSVARQGATATRLSNGRILIAGGRKIGSIDTGDVFFESVEIYQPNMDGFLSVGAQMSAKRIGHTAVLLPGGKVLITGGNGGPAATADLFDPATVAFLPGPSLAHPRNGAASVLLEDERVLVTGGDESSATAELFDASSPAWTETGPMVSARSLHTATRLPDGRVLVAGGTLEGDPLLATSSTEIYDPVADQWASAAAMSDARLGHTATLLKDGRVLVVGGSGHRDIQSLGELATAEVYDPATGAWMAVAPMSVARAFHTANALPNGAVLVAGGADATSSVLRSTELFDPDLAAWVNVGPMTHGRVLHVSASLAQGAVLVAGGELQSSAEVYRPAQIGQPCEVGRQCESGFCVDQVCCNAACDGPCTTCALSGLEGQCSPAGPGTDPHEDCGGGGPCDDVCGEGGTCVSRVGERCVAPECIDDRTRAIVPATCETSGGECARVAIDCSPYRCGPTGSPVADGCLTSCSSVDDCAPGFACDPEGQCRLRPDVAAVDPEACSASRSTSGSPGWIAGLAFALGALRIRRRSR